VNLQSRQFYNSSNGDTWALVWEADRDRIFVLHQANLPSGGRETETDIGTFLKQGNGPEQQELLRLIATLVHEHANHKSSDLRDDPPPLSR
jgi:hypothetical protein